MASVSVQALLHDTKKSSVEDEKDIFTALIFFNAIRLARSDIIQAFQFSSSILIFHPPQTFFHGCAHIFYQLLSLINMSFNFDNIRELRKLILCIILLPYFSNNFRICF